MKEGYIIGMSKVIAVGFAVILALAFGALDVQAQASGDCGCMDVVLVVDDTGSMFGESTNLKSCTIN